MQRGPISACLLVCVGVFTACGGDAAGPPGELTGTYELVTLDGDTLPARWTGADCWAEYRQESITFVSDRDLRLRLRARVVCDAADRDVEVDTYAYGGDVHEYSFRADTLSIYDDDGLMLRGPASGSTLELTGDGAVFVFRK